MGLLFLMVIMTTFQVFIKTIMCNVSSKSSQGLFRSVLSLYESTSLVPFHSEPTYSPLLLLSRINMKNSPVFEFNLSATAGDNNPYSSEPNVWTEQPGLQQAQALGLLTYHGSSLVYIGGRDPFSGTFLDMEILETEGGDWRIWRGMTAEISQYLANSCLTLAEVYTNIVYNFDS